MPTPEQEIQKIIDETAEVITGILFDITEDIPPAQAAQVINAVPLDNIIAEMDAEILGVLETGFASRVKVTPSVASIEPVIINAFADLGNAEFLSKLGNLAGTVKAEVARGVLSGAGRNDIMLAIKGSSLRPDQIETLVNTGLSTFSRTINAAIAQELPPTEKFVYIGPFDEKTRDICIEMMAARPLTLEEIEAQFPGAITDGGGFNCRHNWELDTGENVLHDRKGAQEKKDKLIAADKWKKPRTLREINKEAA